MSKLVCKSFAFLVFAEHRIKPFIRTGMFRVKLLHPLMALPDCFFILRHLRIRLCFPLEVSDLTFLDPALRFRQFLDGNLPVPAAVGKSGSLPCCITIKSCSMWAIPLKVSIGQFYGIEINDFAVTVAKTALWIAESLYELRARFRTV